MPPFYEDATHILLFFTRSGLVISPWIDSPIIIMRLSHFMGLFSRDAKGLTDYGAAVWMMDNLQRTSFVECDDKSRPRLLAMLGTRIGNFMTMQDAAHRRRTRAR